MIVTSTFASLSSYALHSHYFLYSVPTENTERSAVA